MMDHTDQPWRPFTRQPLSTPEELAHEPPPFPTKTADAPYETAYPDWRRRLTRNFARRSDGRWEPLTRTHGAEMPEPDVEQR